MLRKGLIWIHMFHAMVRFTLILLLYLRMLAIEVNHKWDVCPSKDSTQAPVQPHIKLSKYRTRIVWTWWELAWRYLACVLESAFLYIRVCPGLSFATKGFGHLAALYLLLLLVARYKLSYHKTICYHLFQYLQRIPCWEPLIISFCSSLGSTLLLIERTTIDPLYLWVINQQHLWQQEQ